MAFETEKKYRLSIEEFEALGRRCEAVTNSNPPTIFELNEIYNLDPSRYEPGIIRIRTTGDKAQLTFKRHFSANANVKTHIEYETTIGSPEETRQILEAIGIFPTLEYEKRRRTFQIKGFEVVVDELPFGHFAEVEAEEGRIKEIEELLGLGDASAEELTYPALTEIFGKSVDGLISSKFIG
ncbi:MAG: class IV adenylate cyclase [Pyrinomonadaceae bacterium]